MFFFCLWPTKTRPQFKNNLNGILSGLTTVLKVRVRQEGVCTVLFVVVVVKRKKKCSWGYCLSVFDQKSIIVLLHSRTSPHAPDTLQFLFWGFIFLLLLFILCLCVYLSWRSHLNPLVITIIVDVVVYSLLSCFASGTLKIQATMIKISQKSTLHKWHGRFLSLLIFLYYSSSSPSSSYSTTTATALVIPSKTIISSSPRLLAPSRASFLLFGTNNDEESFVDNSNSNVIVDANKNGNNYDNENCNNNNNKQYQKNRSDIRRRNHQNNNNNNRGKKRQQGQNPRPDLIQKWQERQHYIESTTHRLCHEFSEPGSLARGKWHEIFSILCAWSRYAKVVPQRAPIAMEQLIKRLLQEKQYQQTQSDKQKDVIEVSLAVYNSLLYAWTTRAMMLKDKQSAQRAREILVMLQEMYESGNGEAPDSKSFHLVYKTVCEVEEVTVARRLLAWMEYLYKSNKNVNAEPSLFHYNRMLNKYANNQEANSGAMAEAFIRHMHRTGIAQPNTISYNIAIKAWTKSRRFHGGRHAAEHAERIMEEMQAPKDIVTYASVLSAWANSGMKAHAVSRAEDLLRSVEQDPNVSPNTVIINTVMSAWVRSRNPATVDRTRELLHFMEQECENDATIAPDLISYNTHLHALSMHSKDSIQNAQKAADLLTQLEEMSDSGQISFQPNLFTYNLVIDAWSLQTKHDDLMNDKQSEKNLAAAMNSLKTLQKLIARGNGLEPDAFSFNQVLIALSKCSKPGVAQLAEELLEFMEQSYTNGTYKKARPDTIGYTAVVAAWTKSRDVPNAAERAERVVNRMMEQKTITNSGKTIVTVKPSRACFNALIDCWAKSGKGTFAARKAEHILQTMTEMQDASISPDIVTYNSVMNSWAQSGTRCCGNKAESYLNRMWDLYNSGDTSVKPDEKSFNTVINAISKSKSKSKAQRALRILRRMDKLYRAGYKDARPNEVTYTSVLNSCAHPASKDVKTRRKALHTAIFTLEELRKSRYGHPNQLTYSTFIKACANLLSQDDETEIELLRAVLTKAFQECCIDGQVSSMVLHELYEAAPLDLYQQLLAGVLDTATTTISTRTTTKVFPTIIPRLEELPPEWTINVRRGKRKFYINNNNALSLTAAAASATTRVQ